MTIRQHGKVRTHKVHTTDMDACVFFLNWLYDQGIINNPDPDDFNGPADICRYINSRLERYCRGDQEHIQELASDMQYNYECTALPEDKTFWFREDKRACFWVWARLLCSGRSGVYVDDIKSKNPGNHDARYKQVLERLQKYNYRQDNDDEFMQNAKNDWADIFNNASFFSFLSSTDTDSIIYAWNYLCDKKYGINQIYAPLNDEERWLSIMNYLDSVIAKENKGGLATRLKSALEQRKHRHKKQQDSSSRRFYLKKENDNKLKELLHYNRMTMDEYFNQLIEHEYLRVSGNHESPD
ncbi:hypothetical protein G9387_06490 [Enterobacter hormaechei]|uniref:hypothetical protein n=1 Tax=Enterobacter hormaechei TaxID=158836 RepID=UPI0013EFA129|nr:hypothetical protein [Enterobacter hormaechei]KAF6706018.1 hypothetical protein G9393_07245 [Enterobacter hormaechei]KAF6712829.1 hypothetical protein G9387_06490 [Enterobacter hormaechei]